jgi:hypothetical protein
MSNVFPGQFSYELRNLSDFILRSAIQERDSANCSGNWTSKSSEHIIIGPHHQLQLLLNSRQLRAHDSRTDPVRDAQCHVVVRSDRRVTEIGRGEAGQNLGAGTMKARL